MRSNRTLFPCILFALVLTLLFLLDVHTATAQNVDWTTIDRAGGGTGWNDPPTKGGTGASGPATQTFVNLGGTGINMTVSYSGNMWDNNSTPNIYADEAPIDSVRNALRWTNNQADTGGTPGESNGPAQITINFSQPIFVSDFTISTLSKLLNNERYEWIEVRAFDADDTLVIASSFVPSTYDSNNNLLTRSNSPFIITDGQGAYRARGTSTQGTCADICGYDRLTFGYNQPIQRLLLYHYTTTGPTPDSARTTQQSSVSIEGFNIRLPVDYGDLPESAGYATTFANGGPNHKLASALFLGSTVDHEADGQPTVGADGDDNNPNGTVDDEDGVDPTALIIEEEKNAAVVVRLTNQTQTEATLSGWIDFNGNGQFEANERAQAVIPPNSIDVKTTLDFGVAPVNDVTQSYARFRLSTDPAASNPTGAASDGEVEDYPVTIILAPKFDFGDAPASYDGDGPAPSHIITESLRIGLLTDDEAGSQPSTNADGDDLNPTGAPDDEDGINLDDLRLTEAMAATVRLQVTNRTSTAATLAGWIDFNGNGRFEVGEQVLQSIPPGTEDSTVVLDFGLAPVNGVTQSYARFRLSTDPAGANPTGAATDGEVEDYRVTIRLAPTFDFGDAPTSYNGDGPAPSHIITENLQIGLLIDEEENAQPTVNADGDDLNPAGLPDDEDGVTVADLALAEGMAATIRAQVTNRTATAATLYGWIDFNGDGLFAQSERAQATVPTGSENSTVTLDFGATPVNGITKSYARFRLSTDPAAATPNQPAADGEIEEYPVTITLAPEFDYGDAPATYSAGSNGPSHVIAEGLLLGAAIDADSSAQPTVNADGDDRNPTNTVDDEDGVTIADLALVESRPVRIRVQATNRQATLARLYGWIDFDGNGSFDGTERTQLDVPAGSENQEFLLDFGVAPLNSAGQTYARFRLSTDPAATSPTQAAANGEVEDYTVTIAPKPPVDDPQPYFRTRFSGGTPTTLVRPGTINAAAVKLDAFPQSADDRSPDALFSFETALDPTLTTVTDESNDGTNRQWGPALGKAFRGNQGLWVAAGGINGLDSRSSAMPPNLHTWFMLGQPINLVGTKQADIEFRLDLETEAATDTIFVGVSTDNITFRGVTWSGNTGGWEYFDLDLRDYLGYPEVYVAWTFVSNGANADGKDHGGAWLDQVAVWTYVDTDPAIELNEPVLNGGFETSDLSDWVVAPQSDIEVINTSSQVDGDYVAALGGTNNAQDQLYQPVTAASDPNVLAALRFWFTIFGEETTLNNDLFCVRLYGEANGAIDLSNQLLDLGCLDGVEAATPAFDPDAWRLVEWLFSAEEWEAIAGNTVYVLFDLETNATLPTTVYVDGVSVSIVTDGTPGDQLEPNDFPRVAVTTTTTITFPDLTIDPAFDVDVFNIFADAGDTIVVNVDAVRNGSPLDAELKIIDPDQQVICQNDDDPYDSDPYVECPVPTTGTYFAEVSSFSAQGNRDQRYTLDIRVIPPQMPLPINPPPPEPPTPPPAEKTWTAIIYMDGDTDLCGDYQFFRLIERLETDLGDRIGPAGFINVVVLFDRIAGGGRPCNDGGTTRYYIQQNGLYTVDINRWQPGIDYNMGDPETLVHFVTWAMRNYPAEHFYLAIENHGNGISGIAWDYTSRDRIGRLDQLTNRELHSALKTITANGEHKLDILAYEACLMGTYENAFDARQFADYLFFFPTVSYTNNASYPAYLGHPNLTPTTSGRALGEIMFDVYQNAVVLQPYVMTLVDTAAVDALHTAINNWATALIAALATERETVTLVRQLTQKIDSTTRGDEFEAQLSEEDYYLDIWDLADRLEAQGIAVAESRAVKAAVDAVVLRATHRSRDKLDYSRSHGLTIYWPKTASGHYRSYVQDKIYSATTDGQWDEFLQAYFGDAVGGLPANDGPVRRERAEGSNLYLPIIAR